MKEIEMVAGGKAAQSIWERLMAWAEGLLSAPPASPGGIPVTMDDIVTLQRVCVEAGGSFSMDVGTGSGGVLLRVIGVDATVSYVSVRCTQP
jgi:hypothetical protein